MFNVHLLQTQHMEQVETVPNVRDGDVSLTFPDIDKSKSTKKNFPKRRHNSCCQYDLIKCDPNQARFVKQPIIDVDELQLKLDLDPRFSNSKSYELKKLQKILARNSKQSDAVFKENASAPVISNTIKMLFMKTFNSTIQKKQKQQTKVEVESSTCSSSLKSILKDTQSARSYHSRRRHNKRVKFRQDDELVAQRALSQWFWKHAAHQKNRPVVNSSHTVRGSEFNVNINDPHDFGPHFRASTGYFSDHMDNSSCSTDSEYCNGNCHCTIL